jgi:NAD(P) transhydrogenase
VVGSEYACTFAALGIEVSLINAADTFLPFIDEEMTHRLRQSMVSMGVQILMPERVAKIEVICRHELRIVLASGEELITQAILVSVGRASNTELLALDNVGVKTKERGLIEVNQNYQTNVPHIYAAGDVIGFPALSSTSMEQARVAMVHAFDLKYKRTLANILPYGIWTIPEISMAGETEQALRNKRIPYVVGRAYYNRNPRGLILNEQFGMLKLLFSATDQKLLGVHIIGQDACDLVATGLSALTNQVTTDHFINLCFNFPTLSEMYKIATYDAMGNLQAGEILGQA